MRLDARTADGGICCCNGTVEDEDRIQIGIGGLVEGELLQRQVGHGARHGRHSGQFQGRRNWRATSENKKGKRWNDQRKKGLSKKESIKND